MKKYRQKDTMMRTALMNLASTLTRGLLSGEQSQGGPSVVDQLSQQPSRLRRQRAVAVQVTGVALITLYISTILVSHLPGLVDQHQHLRCLLMLVGIAITASGIWVSKREKPTEGMWIIGFGVLALYAILQISSHVGIRTPATFVLLIFIPLSGFVGGTRNMQPAFIGIMSMIVLTYLAERTGLISGQTGHNVSVLEAAFFMQAAVACGLFMLSRVIGESLDLLANLPHESNRIISHELRQPLSTVVAAVQVLSHPQLSDSMKSRTLKSLSNATNVMMGLLDDIADHGKLASGDTELTVAPFSPAAIAHEVFGMYESTALQKGVSPRCRIDIDDRAVLMGDAGRISQILSNLMNNAVKFTEHGEVTLAVSGKISADQPDIMKVRYTVMDTGVGIPKDRQRLIFQAFTKGDEERFNQPGMGLGLSIAKHLTEAMQGSIGFESTRNRGSLFWVEMPLPLAGTASADNAKRQEPVQTVGSVNKAKTAA